MSEFVQIEAGAAARALMDLAKDSLRYGPYQAWEATDERLQVAVYAIERARELLAQAHAARKEAA